MTLDSPFQSTDALRAAFIGGLERQLAEPSLGTFILVLANASFDAGIWPLLKDRLATRFAALASEVRIGLREGQKLTWPEDDLMVFLKLMAMGFDVVAPTEFRRAGPWELQFNALRALRPARASAMQVSSSQPPDFNPNGFHFNKPFLRPEILWEGALQGRDVRLLFNKFPFAALHGLLVPEPQAERPQGLDADLHQFAWDLVETLGPTLPGVLLAYNSYGAHASVNHLHFQMAVRDTPLPVQDPCWQHNGGVTPYPAACTVFTEAHAAWAWLADAQARGQAFNLIYAPGRLLTLPRKLQGSLKHAAWTGGHAWYELAGGATCFSRHDFEALDAEALAQELQQLRPI